MRDLYDIGAYLILIIVMVFIFALGAVYNEPTKLENNCIVHDGKVYCEESNKVEDKNGMDN